MKTRPARVERRRSSLSMTVTTAATVEPFHLPHSDCKMQRRDVRCPLSVLRARDLKDCDVVAIVTGPIDSPVFVDFLKNAHHMQRMGLRSPVRMVGQRQLRPRLGANSDSFFINHSWTRERSTKVSGRTDLADSSAAKLNQLALAFGVEWERESARPAPTCKSACEASAGSWNDF